MVRPFLILLLFIWEPAFPGIGETGDFDGKINLLCTTENGMEIHAGGNPADCSPECIGLPKSFILNFEEKVVTPTRDSVVRRRSRIRLLTHVENKLILQGTDEGVEGVDDGIGWTLSLSRGNGRFVITAAGENVGYTVFGTCASGAAAR